MNKVFQNFIEVKIYVTICNWQLLWLVFLELDKESYFLYFISNNGMNIWWHGKAYLEDVYNLIKIPSWFTQSL